MALGESTGSTQVNMATDSNEEAVQETSDAEHLPDYSMTEVIAVACDEQDVLQEKRHKQTTPASIKRTTSTHQHSGRNNKEEDEDEDETNTDAGAGAGADADADAESTRIKTNLSMDETSLAFDTSEPNPSAIVEPGAVRVSGMDGSRGNDSFVVGGTHFEDSFGSTSQAADAGQDVEGVNPEVVVTALSEIDTIT